MLTNVILDIDETLVSTLALDEFPFTDPSIRKKMLNYDFHNMENYYIVFERPHLQAFLNFLFKNFNVSVWSAGSRDYVSYIINKVILKDPNRKIDYVFWSYHCKESKSIFKNANKDLRLLWKVYNIPEYAKNNTVIVDDLNETWKIQKNNCIKTIPFNVLDFKKDRELLNIKSELLKRKKN